MRAIGVSNFTVDHLTRLLDVASVVPAVNQIEVHPYFAQRAVQAFGAEHGILIRAWSPIGSVIPKSTKPARIAENIDVFDFDLTADELAAIDAPDTDRRGGPEPEAITLEAIGRPGWAISLRGPHAASRAAGSRITPARRALQDRWRSPTVLYAPPSPLPRTGRCRTLLRSPSASRYPTAVRSASSSDRTEAVSVMPAGSVTRSRTRSGNAVPVARSASGRSRPSSPAPAS